MFDNLLISILAFPLVGVFVLLFVPSNKQKLLKLIALNLSSLPFIGSLFLWAYFKKSSGYFQFVTKLDELSSLNLNMTLGIDGISLFFILLTTLLIPICILLSWDIFYIVPVHNIGGVWPPKAITSKDLCSIPRAETAEYKALCLAFEETHKEKIDNFIYCPPYPGNLTLLELFAWVDTWTTRADIYATGVIEDPSTLFDEFIGLTDPSQVAAAYRIYRICAPCAGFMWCFADAMLVAKYIKFRQPLLVNLTQEEQWGIIRPLIRNNPSEVPLRNHFSESEFNDFIPWGNFADHRTEFHNINSFDRILGYLERSDYETSHGRRLMRNSLKKVLDEQENPCPTLREMSPETYDYDNMGSLTLAGVDLFHNTFGQESSIAS